MAPKVKKAPKTLPAKPVGKNQAGSVGGGTRDAATGLPTGKRIWK